MSLYSPRDVQDAARSLRNTGLMMAAVLLPLLAGYVLVLVRGWYAATVALALAMLAFCLLAGDLLLVPRLRYARFLREMNSGLRRSVDCVPERLDGEIQVQDGVRVYCLQVRLVEGGDSRVFYLNASKLDFMPEMGKPVRLVSYGRHAVEFMVI